MDLERERQKEILANYERARVLADLKRHPGYDLLMQMMDERAKEAENKLWQAEWVDKDRLFAIHRYAIAFRDAVECAKTDVENAIDLAEQYVKSAIEDPVEQY